MDLINLGKEPIAGEQPAGADARYEPEFESLQAEIDKLASPSAGQVDWKSIVDGAAGILASKSKDLTAASYLAVGLIRTQKADGLVQGTRVLKDLLETYWDTLYPPKKRMRGRAGAITWWFERSVLELKRFAPGSLPAASAASVHADLKNLEQFLAAQLPDAPRLGPLLRLVESLSPPETAAAADGASAPERPPAPVQTKTEQTVAPAPVKDPGRSPEAGETITSVLEARRALDAMLQRMRQASLFLLQNDFKDPMAYRCRRIASWAKLQAPPPANAEGATRITSPAPQVREALVKLADENNWPALIENAEQKLSQFVFWFDLNRYVAEALSALGPDHGAALLAVCQETAFLLQRLPGVERLQFADGMPFADDQTITWLQSIRPAAGRPRAPAPAAAAEPTDLYQSTVLEAQALARGKKIVEAVQILQKRMQRSGGRHEWVRWQMAIVQLLLNAKKHSAALPLLEQLLQEIEDFRLEVWDPALALECLVAVWQAFGSQGAGEYKTRAPGILQRIARIDPAAALRLSG